MLTAQDIQHETLRRKEKFQEYLHSKEYQEKLVLRLQLNDAARDNVEVKGTLWNLCARPENPAEGCIFFIENFAWTFDPRPQADPSNLPFILFEYQKEAIREAVNHIIEGTDFLIEKSRDMGVTWLVFVWIPIWFWLFRDGVNILIGSYKESLVDNRTRDSLFGMIDYGVESLPKWILPKGFNKIKHRTQMKLVNPVNYNQITGDTMNPKFGRGTRKTAILFDELGFWDYAKDAWEASGDSTSCRIANSTVNGYNYYADLRHGGIDVLTLHWKLHPLKDEFWYQYEKLRRTEEEVAQELDISYEKSAEGKVYKEWNGENVTKELVEYDPTLPLFVSWDFGKSDDTAIIWSQRLRDGKLVILDTYCKSGYNIDYFIPFITGIIPGDMKGYHYTDQEEELIYSHRNWRPGTHFGDPAGRFENQNAVHSVIEELKLSNIRVNFKEDWKYFKFRKPALKLLMRDGVILNPTSRTKYFDMCINQAQYPRVTRQGVPETVSKEPVHNWTSHYRSAFEYLALGLQDSYNAKEAKPYDKFKPKKSFNYQRSLSY